MISSIVVRKNTTFIDFIKIEIDLLTGKLQTKTANYPLTGELREFALQKHRVCLPCKITINEDIDNTPYGASLYVPIFWEVEMIENYTQALMDEIYLYKYNIPGNKNIKQIEQSFMLEVILL